MYSATKNYMHFVSFFSRWHIRYNWYLFDGYHIFYFKIRGLWTEIHLTITVRRRYNTHDAHSVVVWMKSPQQRNNYINSVASFPLFIILQIVTRASEFHMYSHQINETDETNSTSQQ